VYYNRIRGLIQDIMVEDSWFNGVNIFGFLRMDKMIKTVKEFLKLESHANLEVLEYLTGIDGMKKHVDDISCQQKPMDRTQEERDYDVFKEIQKTTAVARIDQNEFHDPVEGYRHFETQNFQKSLTMLCQVNPFFASALSTNGSNFELIGYSPQPPPDNDPKYLKSSEGDDRLKSLCQRCVRH